MMDLRSGTYSLNWRENSVTGSVFTSSSGSLSGVEVVSDSDGNDTLRGSNFTATSSSGRIIGETFQLSEGVDFVNGRGGVDTIAIGQYKVSNVVFSGTVINVGAGTMRGLDGVTDSFVNIERFSMTENADTFTGDKTDNWVIGYGGGDTLIGRKGFDVIDYKNALVGTDGVFVDTGTGAASSGTWTDTFVGFEQIRGTRENDTMRGGAKSDDFWGYRGDDLLRGFDGDDRLVGEDDNDTLEGGRGNDILLGGDDNDTLRGGKDDDQLSGRDGVDTIDGGSGRDTLNFSFADFADATLGVNVTLKNGKVIDPFANNETVKNVENVIGTGFKDLIKGDKEDNDIYGKDGRDNLGGLGGDDRLFGGKGKDSLGGGDDHDKLYGGEGDDTLFGGLGKDKLFGGDGEDILFGEKGADILNGGDGDDQLRDDKSYLNMYTFGNETIRDAISSGFVPIVGANKKANILTGKDGDDKVFGTGYLMGGDGKDILRGAGYLDGGKGNDKLVADKEFDATGSGYAVLSGGMGNDILKGKDFPGSTASYIYSDSALDLNLLNGVANLGSGDKDTLINISGVFGTRLDDTMRGSLDAAENLYGLGGNDKITVRTSAITIDTAVGGKGNDKLYSYGDGVAHLSGGQGADKVFVRSAKGDVTGGTGNDVITFYRNDADEFDTAKGGSGNDTFILKGSGSGSFEGGSGNDTFKISGGVALDDRFIIAGGAGRDTIILKSAVKQVRVTDFQIGQDKLKIQGALPNGINSFAALKAAAQDTGSEVLIDLADGGILFLSGMDVSDLKANMFDF